jgi:hypothetical protein
MRVKGILVSLGCRVLGVWTGAMERPSENATSASLGELEAGDREHLCLPAASKKFSAMPGLGPPWEAAGSDQLVHPHPAPDVTRYRSLMDRFRVIFQKPLDVG